MIIQHLGMDDAAILSIDVRDEFTRPPGVFQFTIPGTVEFRAVGHGWYGTNHPDDVTRPVVVWDCEGWFANGTKERMYLYGKLAEVAAANDGRVLSVVVGWSRADDDDRTPADDRAAERPAGAVAAGRVALPAGADGTGVDRDDAATRTIGRVRCRTFDSSSRRR